MPKILKYLLGGVAGLLLLLVLLFLGWTQFGVARPAPEALAALQSDGQVIVDTSQFVTFRPTAPAPELGLILYPGSNCDARGYSAVLRRIAAQGYLVVSVPMPFNQAIFAIDRADEVRAAYPDIKRWVIAGHSMGGSMAAHYAHEHPKDLAGLIIWDSRPGESDSLVDLAYPVWHIHRATPDGKPPPKFERYRPLFPVNSTWVPVTGGIHMYFGSFEGGTYREDWAPQISRDEEHDIVVTATLNALKAMSARTATSGAG